MPIKNNRNSRDDKSTKFNKPARTDQSSSSANRKAERPEGTNTTKKKLFGSDSDRPKGAYQKSEDRRPDTGKPYGEKKSFNKDSSFSSYRTERKPYGDQSKGERKPYGSREGEGGAKFERKPYGDRPQGERKSFGDRPQGERKPYGDRPQGERRSFGRPEENHTDRKPYSDRPKTDRKPYGDRPQGERKPFERGSEDRSDRKPYNSERPQGEKKPYGDKSQGERKPYSRSEGNRTERSFSNDRPRADKRPFDKGEKTFEKKPYGSRSDDNFRPYDREKNYRSDDRKWSSEEKLKTVNRSKKPATAKDDGLIRLNRFIAAGVVSVNGEAVTELGFKVDPAKDLVRYNGVGLKREKMVYVLLNKPKDYITTTDDPQERKTVMKLVEKASKERIYPVGRLDRNTTGLLLMTNDGDLAEKLSHPRNNVTKIYQVELNRNVPQGDLNKISFGLELEDGLIKPDLVSYVAGGSKNEIGIQIHSGKNRIVRRIFEHLGYEVVKLDRVVYSNLTKKDLPRGHWRYLEEKEIIQLKHLIK
jgi:23S rRNA pseudouridine2605 synthase